MTKAQARIKMCVWHKPSLLSYVDAAEDAERRIARGQKQKQCSVCKRWFWWHEFGTKPKEKKL